ncbi:MAG TPA: methyltransferase domain-containing protein [Solirubrobacterales bacterium]|nr:methyltransferase domain-containing protein [Solirubrobacterales bacterium]
MPAPPLTPLAAAVLHVGEPERVLQVECGEGDAALFLAREFPRARIRGVDRSEQAIRRATARVGLDPEGRVAFKVGSPSSLPYPKDHFDLLAGIDVAPDPAEAGRVLRRGGHLLLARTAGGNAAGGWRWRRRLRRAGFRPVAGEAAGDGSFSVARLGEVGPASNGV